MTFDLFFRHCLAAFCVNFCRCEGSNLGIGMDGMELYFHLLEINGINPAINPENPNFPG